MKLLFIHKRYCITRCSAIYFCNYSKIQKNRYQDPEFNLVIVGGGIVGTATAREILIRHPFLKIAILEKENQLAIHQSGHNSGVIHAGIYYAPGSLKAKLCVQGMQLIYDYLDEKKIEYRKCGKLIVAVNNKEEKNLMNLYERSQKNNVKDVLIIEQDAIRKYEPYCKGTKAIWSPHTGIVDWSLVTKYFAKDVENMGGKIFFNFNVSKFEELKESQLNSETKKFYPIRGIRTEFVLVCGGLYSDKLAKLSGCSTEPKIVPFRGEYLILSEEKSYLVQGNIYPVPDPRFPFLGVHFTPRMDGTIWIGPNAVLAFGKESYHWTSYNLFETLEMFRFPGFRKMIFKYMNQGLTELSKSLFISQQIADLHKYIPDIRLKDIRRGPTGVRAQAMNEDGNLVEDFVFDQGTGTLGQRILHCRNTPSPAATSSLAIAKMIADKAELQFSF